MVADPLVPGDDGRQARSVAFEEPLMVALVCPVTRQSLRLVSIEEADGQGRRFIPRQTLYSLRTPLVMLREDGEGAYPVIDQFPILLAPEMLVREGSAAAAGTYPAEPLYREAYDEASFYSGCASGDEGEAEMARYQAMLEPVRTLTAAERALFPMPKERWIDDIYGPVVQFDCYRHLAPLSGRTVMQLGGKGLHAVKFLLGGAGSAWLLTPMLDECRWAVEFAKRMDVGERLRCVVGVAEEMPFSDASFDGIYGGGTVHHLTTEVAMPEIRRVLRPGGRFSASEPWRTPLYGLGTKIFGKLEANAFCRPLDRRRLAPFAEAFDSGACVHHGALTRYPLIVFSKFGLNVSVRSAWAINRVDDAIASPIPLLRKLGSNVALLATVPAEPS
jgi:uncharacterized protein YbaR (Trm112 family)